MMSITDYFPPYTETVGERLQRQHERKKLKKLLRDC